MSPLHPAIVHFPIALFTLSFAADVVSRIRNNGRANVFAVWCLVFAVVSAAAAVAVGTFDMVRADLAEATHRFVHLHRDIGFVVLAGLALLALWRWWTWYRTASVRAPGWPYILSATAVFALLVFQGWFGGQLVYGLGAGVSAAGQGVVSPEEGQMGLAPFARFTGAVHDHQGP